MKKFWINAGTFDFDIEIVVSKNREKVAKHINKKLSLPNEKCNYTYKEDDFKVRGRYCEGGKYCSRIFLPKIPRTNIQIATLVHELQHAIFDLASFYGVSYSVESEEVYTHLLSHLTEQSLRKMKIKIK